MSESLPPDLVSSAKEYGFAGFQLKGDGTLLHGEAVVHLPPKELAALRYLLERPGEVVSSAELLSALWDGVHVTPDSVPKCLSSLRSRLEPEDCIQTVYKRGYRFAAEVRKLGTPMVRQVPRLAVMPLITGFQVPEHLGPTVAEGLIQKLSNLRPARIAVLARDSVFTLARSSRSALEVAKAVQADWVLTGTVHALSAFLRVRIEMIRVQDGVQLWGEDLMLEHDRLAELELELVERIAIRLGGEQRANNENSRRWSEEGEDSRRHQNEAYQSFLRGHYEWQSMQRHRMQDGMRHLNRATELDPSLTSAKSELIQLSITQAFYGFMAPRDAAAQVRQTAEGIPSNSQQMVRVLPALGLMSFLVDHNVHEAERAFAASAHLPHDGWTTRARVLYELGRQNFDNAISHIESALIQDPFSPWLHGRLAEALHLAGERTRSVEQIETCLRSFADHEVTAIYGTMILGYNGQKDRAEQIAAGMAKRFPYMDIATSLHAYTLALTGKRDEALALLERLEWMGRERYVMRSFLPAAYVALGEMDKAMLQLRRAYDDRCPWALLMMSDPRLTPLHGRPEFEQMRSLGPGMDAELRRAKVWTA